MPVLQDGRVFCIRVGELLWKGNGKHFQSRVAFALSSGAKSMLVLIVQVVKRIRILGPYAL